MTFDEEIASIVGNDQTEAALKAMAEVVALYWLTLTKAGVCEDAATELTLPLVSKMLGTED